MSSNLGCRGPPRPYPRSDHDGVHRCMYIYIYIYTYIYIYIERERYVYVYVCMYVLLSLLLISIIIINIIIMSTVASEGINGNKTGINLVSLLGLSNKHLMQRSERVAKASPGPPRRHPRPRRRSGRRSPRRPPPSVD